MGEVKAKVGAMFAASQQMNNPDGLEFTGDTARAVATRVSNANFEKEKKQAADEELRRVTETTAVVYMEGRQLLMGSRIYS
jgi:predicted exporter